MRPRGRTRRQPGGKCGPGYARPEPHKEQPHIAATAFVQRHRGNRSSPPACKIAGGPAVVPVHKPRWRAPSSRPAARGQVRPADPSRCSQLPPGARVRAEIPAPSPTCADKCGTARRYRCGSPARRTRRLTCWQHRCPICRLAGRSDQHWDQISHRPRHEFRAPPPPLTATDHPPSNQLKEWTL